MKRRTIIINSVLGVAILGVGAATAFSAIGGAPQQPTGTLVSVQRGTVSSTVTATGNVEAGSTVAVNPSGSGEVTKIYVKVGTKVAKGDKLLKIDDTSARQDLKTAKASLASAEAGMTTTTQGRSTQDQAVDDAGVRSAQTALSNARKALSQAKATYALDQKQQHALVNKADSAVEDAKDQLSDAKSELAKAQRELASETDPTKTTELQNQVTQAQSAVTTAENAVTTAKSSLTQAQQTRDKTLLSSKQNVQTQEGQVSAAGDSLASQEAQRASNQQPAREGAVESAQAQIDNARVSVEQAEQAVKDTTVRAPVDGTVADISAVRGQSSSSAGGGSASGGSSGGTSGNETSGSSGTSSSSSSSGSGLVSLVNEKVKQITASVAEADIVKVKSGQTASVTFPASSKTLSGKVTSVATQSTVSNNVVQYDVAISLPTANSTVRLGQTGDVTITTASHADVLYVPTSAITTTGNQATVTRRADGTDATVQIETGLVGSVGTEVTRGLNEGDQLVLPTGTGTQGFTFPGGPGGSAGSDGAGGGSGGAGGGTNTDNGESGTGSGGPR